MSCSKRWAKLLAKHDLARGIARVSLGLLLASFWGGCSSPADEASLDEATVASAGAVALFAEVLPLEDGGTLEYDRGIATLPLRRDNPSSGSVDVEFLRFRRTAEADPDTPPIVLLHGGPGFGGLAPRLTDVGYFETRMARYTRIADVVVPGQRGFGSSGATPCDPLRELTVEEALDPDLRRQATHEATTRCREKWQAEGLDLKGFNVVEAAADVADIARLLGYEKVQLRGISFGSHWGMTILRNHPERVARATLASLEGPDHTYDMPSGVLATLERIATAAERSPVLAARIPEDGFVAAYGRLIASADTEPIAVEVEHPRTEELLTVRLDGDDLRQIFAGSRRFTTFRYQMPRWSLALLPMLEGDLRDAASSHLWNLLDSGLNDAAFYQYDCGSGMSSARGEKVRNDPARALLGATWSRLDTLCEAWDADLGASFRSAFKTDVPTVLVQGDWDTATPYENALELLPYFENRHFVRVKGGSHGSIREAIEGVPGFVDAMDHGLATGESEQIPDAVDLPPIAWKAEG